MQRSKPTEEFIKQTLGNNYRLLASTYAGLCHLTIGAENSAIVPLYPRINLDTCLQLAYTLRQINTEQLTIIQNDLELPQLITDLVTTVPVRIDHREFYSAAHAFGSFARLRDTDSASILNPYKKKQERKNLESLSDEEADAIIAGIMTPQKRLITGKDTINNDEPVIELPFYDHYKTQSQKDFLATGIKLIIDSQRTDIYGQQKLL